MSMLGMRPGRRGNRAERDHSEEPHWKHDGINAAAMTGRMMANANKSAIPAETVEMTRLAPSLVRPLRQERTPAASVTIRPTIATMMAGTGAKVSQ